MTSQAADDGLAQRLFADEWPAARAAWKASDPVLYRAASPTPVDRPIDEMPTHFAALTRSIIHQQVSMAAGRAIGARFLAVCGGAWTAEAVRALSDEELLGAGLSRAKARYVSSLAEADLRGDLATLEGMSDEDVIARLVTLPGIGLWTAKMFLLFHLRRPDIFSGDDLGLRLGIALLEDRPTPPTPAEAEARAEPWRPYRSVASLVLWDLVRRTRAERAADAKAAATAKRSSGAVARSMRSAPQRAPGGIKATDPIASPAEPSLRIVRAQINDLDTIVAILEEGARWLSDEGIEQWPVGLFSALPHLIADGIAAGEFHLVYLGETPVGALRLQWSDERMWPGADDGEAGYVHSLAVRRAWSGRGIGRQMLAWSEAEVAAAGRAYLRLDCVAHNVRLLRYYEEAGFTRRGRMESHWGDSSTVHQRFEKRVVAPS